MCIVMQPPLAHSSPFKPLQPRMEQAPLQPPPITMPSAYPAPLHMPGHVQPPPSLPFSHMQTYNHGSTHIPSHVPSYVIGQALLHLTFTDDPSLAPPALQQRSPSPSRELPAGAVAQGTYEELTAALSRLRFDSSGGPVLKTALESHAISSARVLSAEALPRPPMQQCQDVLVHMVSVPLPSEPATSHRVAASSHSSVPPAGHTTSDAASLRQPGTAEQDRPAHAQEGEGSHGIDANVDLTATLSKDGGAVVLQNPDGSTALVLLTSDAVRQSQQEQAALRSQYGPCVNLSTYQVGIQWMHDHPDAGWADAFFMGLFRIWRDADAGPIQALAVSILLQCGGCALSQFQQDAGSQVRGLQPGCYIKWPPHVVMCP